MTKDERYNGQLIRSVGEARLVPPNSDYPDSICSLVLTESNFYVLERRFNGTYEEYFNIPLKQLERMELVRPNRGSGIKAVLLGLVALLGGWIWISVPENRDYLELDYSDGQGARKSIKFVELDGDIKKLVKHYRGD